MNEPATTDAHATPPLKDPLIDEVRMLRRRVSERFDHDLARLLEHLRAIEATHPGGVSAPPTRGALPGRAG